MTQDNPVHRSDAAGPPDIAPQASASASRFTNIVAMESVDSTNRAVLDAFAGGASEGLVVLARRQLAGRGRRGRSWIAPPGGALLCSVLFEPSLAMEAWPLVATALSLATLDAIDELAPCDAALKWPNDIVVAGKKLAGVLAETGERKGEERRCLVVGIGLNLNWPDDWPGPAEGPDAVEVAASAITLARAAGRDVAPDALAQRMLIALEVHYRELCAPGGPARLIAAYRARCATIGEEVRVTLSSGEFTGLALGVDERGRLQVRREGATVTLDAADVVHLREHRGVATRPTGD